MSGEYDVGYKKPPATHQFQKGQSGNLKGKAKKGKVLYKESYEKFLALFHEELHRSVKVKVDGRIISMAKSRVMMRSFADKAAKGDDAAGRFLLRFLRASAEFADQQGLLSAPYKAPSLASFYGKRDEEGSASNHDHD